MKFYTPLSDNLITANSLYNHKVRVTPSLFST